MPRCLLACLLLPGLACGPSLAEQHLQNELSFLVPYVDVLEEERAVRRVFAQRRLLVEDRLEGPGYVALSGTTLDRSKSAVRIITRRGVVVGEDGDSQDWFALARVALLHELTPADSSQPLLGVLRTARGRSEGCVILYQLLPDGRAELVDVQVQRFGSLACVAELRALDEGHFVAHIGWPELASLGAPRLEVDLERPGPRPGRAPVLVPPLRVIEDGDWLDREGRRAARALPATAPFSARHAQGVLRAALALAAGRSTQQQLAAYGAVLGRVPPGSPEAEVVAATSAHIERGWSDAAPPAPEPAPAELPHEPDPDAVVIEPGAERRRRGVVAAPRAVHYNQAPMAKKPAKGEPGELLVCRASKTVARYVIDERLEAGMVLTGSEVKSLRDRKADLEGAYARVERGELMLHKMFIAPYAQATAFAHEPKRSRKLLAHRHEIEKLTGKLALRGYTLLPVQVYFKQGRAKVELGLAKAKDIGDKREDLKRKADLREARAAMAKGRGR